MNRSYKSGFRHSIVKPNNPRTQIYVRLYINNYRETKCDSNLSMSVNLLLYQEKKGVNCL